MGSRLESNSKAVRKRIESHTFDDEEGDEYEGSKFGGFPEYFRRKKIKLQNLDHELRSQSSGNPPIFRGVVVHVNGYTQPSLNDLHKLIVTHGGGFMQYLDGKTTVTHIVASNITLKKAAEFKKYRIVKPAWVVESVQAGHLLPWDNYRVVDEGRSQKVLGFDNGKVVSQVNNKPKGYRDQTESSWYTRQLQAEAASSTPELEAVSQVQDPIDQNDHVRSSDQNPSEMSYAFSSAIFDDNQAVNAGIENEQNPSHEFARLSGEDSQGKITIERRDSEKATDDRQTALEEPSPMDPPQNDSVERPQSGLVPKTRTPGYRNQADESPKRSSSTEGDSPSKRAKMTAEDHNAILLADPRIRKTTAVNPDFLEQYYRESRLHHLSAWKAQLKSKMQALTAEKSASQKERQKRIPGSRRYILHVDFDSFFAAVSLKSHPQYKDKPVVVAHGSGSGSEIASCNYPAREYGIKNGMWMKKALELCPDLKVLPYDFPEYEKASTAFYEAILATEGVVQSVSVDEALVDVSSLCLPAGGSDGKGLSEGSIYREQEKADEIAQKLRAKIREQTGCEVSVGIGGNILLAKVALRKAKPAGQYQLKPEDVLDFIGKLEVQNLPGVAWSIGGRLEEIGIKLIKDIRDFSREKLISTLGPKTGEKIWEYARGIDRAEVGDQVVRKSVSAEVNWGVRFENQAQADEFVESLSGELSKRLLKEGVKGRQLTMKVMRRSQDSPLEPPKHLGHGKCDTFNKSLTFGVATNAKDVLAREAVSMLKAFRIPPGELRGIGIQMTKLDPMKSVGFGQLDSSQKRLQFKVDGEHRSPTKESEDPIQDDVKTPKKSTKDPLVGTFFAGPVNSDSPSHKPLNTLGTQFMLPTQVDPQLLAELPEDIRSKLVRTLQPAEKGIAQSPPDTSDEQPPTVALTAVPAESQLDQATLNALPEDVRGEILAFYQSSPLHDEEQQPPQSSPQKSRGSRPRGRPRGRAGRQRGSALLSRGQGASKPSAESRYTLTQSNFVAARPVSRAQSHDHTSGDTASESEDIALDILEALPPDIRQEVLAEHRAARLRRRGGLAVSAAPGRARRLADIKALAEAEAEDGQPILRFLQLAPKPSRPTFSTQKLSSLPDLRTAVTAWWEEFRDEGPYGEDVEALVGYLTRVVREEGNMDKAVSVVKWMRWVVEEGCEAEARMERGTSKKRRHVERWHTALATVEQGLQDAVKARGLGEVAL